MQEEDLSPAVSFEPTTDSEAEIIDTSHTLEDYREITYLRWNQVRMKILWIVSGTCLLAALTNSMYYPMIPSITQQFDINPDSFLASLSVGIYNLTFAFLPLLWGPLSDRYGRRILFLCSIISFVAVSFATGFCPNIYVMIFLRFLIGFPLSTLFVVATSIILDVFPPESQGKAMGLLGLLPLFGPIIGPLLSGLITEYIGWQINFGFLAVLGTFFFFLNLFFLPETLNKMQDGIKFDLFSPFRLLLSPSVAFVAFLLSLGMAGILVSQLIMSNQFKEVYNYGALELGLAFMPLGIGNVIGSLTGGAASDVAAKKLGLGGRLIPVVLSYSVIIFSFGLFGWSLNWNSAFPIILLFISGVCRTASGPACIAFVADGRHDKSGSVIAALSSSQFFFGFLGQTISPPLAKLIDKDNINDGYGWVMSGLGCLILVTLIPVAILMVTNISTKKRFHLQDDDI